MSTLLKTPRKLPKWYVLARNAGYWIVARLFFGLIAFLKLFPADAAIDTIERAGRYVGMRYPRTETARQNLKLAFPDKTAAEIEEILGDMWGSLSRTAAEYAYLDQIFDFDDQTEEVGRFEITGIPNFAELKALDGPAICFTAHTANWEVLPVAAAAYGVNVTALFRPPNNPYIARRVLAARHTAMGHLVPSKAGAAWALADVMREGGKVGLLVDQFYKHGVPIDFFGRRTLGNQLLAKLVRQFDCPVYPVRSIRLPDGRFRIEMQDRIDIPRDDKGRVDINALTQQVNTIVEGWIREYPGQWLWLHKRWRKRTKRKRLKRKKKPA
ncbi:MAG: lipid A biosynthesis lauroyl acyltransferase [Pseudomonadota bacterium]|nr:lipid A biosynthesis lauroyl acyltransferase [Pseudomonadota bacterium]